MHSRLLLTVETIRQIDCYVGLVGLHIGLECFLNERTFEIFIHVCFGECFNNMCVCICGKSDK